MNAFALVSLQWIREFHLSTPKPSIPHHPYRILPIPAPPQTDTSRNFIPCKALQATETCLKHSKFFKVTGRCILLCIFEGPIVATHSWGDPRGLPRLRPEIQLRAF